MFYSTRIFTFCSTGYQSYSMYHSVLFNRSQNIEDNLSIDILHCILQFKKNEIICILLLDIPPNETIGVQNDQDKDLNTGK